MPEFSTQYIQVSHINKLKEKQDYIVSHYASASLTILTVNCVIN